MVNPLVVSLLEQKLAEPFLAHCSTLPTEGSDQINWPLIQVMVNPCI